MSPPELQRRPGDGSNHLFVNQVNCQDSNPHLERLASAIKRGDVHYVRPALDEGLDLNETWRDLPPQVCLSLLLSMELMIKTGANLSLSCEVWDNSNMRPLNAVDVAIRRKDIRMADLLRRAGAPPGIWGPKPRRLPAPAIWTEHRAGESLQLNVELLANFR